MKQKRNFGIVLYENGEVSHYKKIEYWTPKINKLPNRVTTTKGHLK